MSEIKDSEIYPKFEFRLSAEDKEWLMRELEELKVKFNCEESAETPTITKNVLIMAALRSGIQFLKSRERVTFSGRE